MLLTTAQTQPTEQQAPAKPQKGHAQLLNANIFIVDDESTTMEIVKAFLEETGYHNFVLIEDPGQAMAFLESKQPDLLLLDLIMPRVSGFDILEQVRRHPQLGHLPVIILTSSSDNRDKLKALELGATDFLAKPVDPSELRLRVRNTLAAKSYMDRLSYYDPLTQLPNRHLFMERLEAGLTAARSRKEKLAVLSIELDQFDKLRDTMGLKAGDEVLQRFTRRFSGVIQGIDMMAHMEIDPYLQMSLFHFDGGIFTLLLPHIASERDAANVAGCLLESARNMLDVNNTELYLTASIGIATFPTQDGDGHGMLQLASSAKDHVSSRGGDAFQFSSRRIHTVYQKRLTVEARLRKALDRDELRLFYQPKLDVHTNRIKGVEALLRWQVNANTLVPPNIFVPIAEDTGLIEPFGEWVLRQACKQMTVWQKAGKAPIEMSVNLSPVQLQNKAMPAVFEDIVKRSGIPFQRITLEVTEGMLMEDIEKKIATLQRLRKAGFKISIDDFGTGYSSLSYLKKLPIDELKIDRTFFIDLFADTKSRALVSALIYLARSLNLTTVAEGVEKENQLDFLQKGACDQYQGFLFSPPLPPDQLLKKLDPAE